MNVIFVKIKIISLDFKLEKDIEKFLNSKETVEGDVGGLSFDGLAKLKNISDECLKKDCGRPEAKKSSKY